MAEDRRKTITFTADGADYTLEYTPRSVRKMEQDGFDFTKMESMVISTPYEMFSGAFISRHNYVPKEDRYKMYEMLKNENENGENLLETLSDMLKDEIEYITSKPQGNVNWAVK